MIHRARGGNRTRLAGLEDRCLFIRSATRAWSRGRESNPRVRRVAAGGLSVLATSTKKADEGSSLGGSRLIDNPATAVRSALIPSAEEAGRVELPGPWPGRLAPDCAKPPCASLPWRRAEHSKPTLSRQSAFEAAPAPWLVHPPCESQESNLLSLPCRGSAVPSGSTRVSTAATPTGFEPVFLP